MATKKYFWITDPHFNFVNPVKLKNFFLRIKSEHPDGIFITGDISTGPEVIRHLQWIAEDIAVPTYFVLGNHDFYRSSFQLVEEAVVDLTKRQDNLFYMNKCNVIQLSSDTALIGHDGWYDSNWRVPYTSLIFIWDFFFIKDFRALFSNEERLELVRERAKIASLSMVDKLETALKNNSTVYLITHIPPWPEQNEKWGGLIEKFWTPFNSSKVIAEALINVMGRHSDKKLIILSGHTHHARKEIITHNIELRVGSASHNVCEIQEAIFIRESDNNNIV